MRLHAAHGGGLMASFWVDHGGGLMVWLCDSQTILLHQVKGSLGYHQAVVARGDVLLCGRWSEA